MHKLNQFSYIRMNLTSTVSYLFEPSYSIHNYTYMNITSIVG